MARMILELISPDTKSQAEVRAFNLFKNSFDDSWTVFHSYRLRGENLDGKLIDSEIDFLLFNPKYGLMVFEVKGGVISFSSNGKCYQNNRQISDPEFQARINKYSLLKMLKRRLKATLPLKVAHAVYFPDSFVETAVLPPAYDSVVFSGCDTPYLEKCLIELLSRIKVNKYCELSDSVSRIFLEKLNPNTELGNTMLDRLEQNKQLFPVITEIQAQLLDFIGSYKRALIQGCAGSGKTIMAIKKARELALQNKKVLLLCYNSLLSEKLKDAVKDLNEFIHARTYHSFCVKLLCSNNEAEYDYNSVEFWDEVIPELMQDYLSKNKFDYDAVIIDEAQDFRYQYWLNIIEQVKEDTICYVFYDSAQNIFGTDFELPFQAVPFTLNRVCRNSVSIIDYMRNHVDFEIKPFEASPVGEDVKIVNIGGKDSGIKELKKTVSELIKNNKVKPENITILGAHSFSTTFGCESIKYSDVAIVDGVSEQNPKADFLINYYTFMKFKGCESDVVILYGVDLNDSRWRNGIYTAASRARSLLYVLNY